MSQSSLKQDRISNIAQELIYTVQAFPPKGAAGVLEFARNYAITPELKQRAVLLKTQLAEEPGHTQTIAELIDLVAMIQEDYYSRHQSDDLLRQHIQGEEDALPIPAKREIVFTGKQVCKRYGGRSNFALTNVSIELRLGEVLGVVGENGNGKTTFLRIMAGDLQHSSGSLRYPLFQSEPGEINWQRVKQQIAYIPQELPKWFGSLEDNIAYEAAVHGIKGKENKAVVDYIIQRLGLQSHVNKRWKELSGGYKLRFSLAKALVWRPQLLIIDEPLANLDINTQLIVLNDLRSMASSLTDPLAVVITSQHLVEIESISDQLLFMREGKVEYYGAREHVGLDRETNTYEFASSIPTQVLEEELKGFDYISLEHNGLAYVLSTSMDVSLTDVARELGSRNIPLSYLRDISQSTKKLFL